MNASMPDGPKKPSVARFWRGRYATALVFAMAAALVWADLASESSVIMSEVGAAGPMSGDRGDDAPIDEVTGLTWCHATEDPASCFPQACDGGKKKVVVYVGTSWCGWCTKLKRETLANPQVKARLKGVGLVFIDADEAPGMATKFGARGYPHIVILDDDCTTKLGQQSGYLDADRFLDFLKRHGM